MNPDASSLSLADPESFGYLSPRRASIVLNGSQLEFAPESEVSVTGGDVSFTGTETQLAGMIVEGGNIHIHATGEQTGEVRITGKADFEMRGNLLMESARIESGGDGGGNILIQAGSMEADASAIIADNTGSENAQDGTEVRVGGMLELISGAKISSSTWSEGNECVCNDLPPFVKGGRGGFLTMKSEK
ncbi:MAG: hypothetical protein B6245_16505 [Desulfobacteraceae bacterium 4572_88]|nr:MAG: hypothetical protein B6245_16505 [Desulfobacteraceae bacterium 4572_88]